MRLRKKSLHLEKHLDRLSARWLSQGNFAAAARSAPRRASGSVLCGATTPISFQLGRLSHGIAGMMMSKPALPLVEQGLAISRAMERGPCDAAAR